MHNPENKKWADKRSWTQCVNDSCLLGSVQPFRKTITSMLQKYTKETAVHKKIETPSDFHKHATGFYIKLFNTWTWIYMNF